MASYSPLDPEAQWEDKGPSSVHAQDPSYSFASQQVRLGFTRKVFGELVGPGVSPSCTSNADYGLAIPSITSLMQ